MATSGNSQGSRALMSAIGALVGIELDPSGVIEIERGEKLIIPENAFIPDVIKALEAKHNEETQVVQVRAAVQCPPWDGAMALQKAIQQELGLVVQQEQVHRSFFGTIKEPAGEIEVEIGYGKTATVQWGQFGLPGMGDATAVTSAGYDQSAGVYNFNVIIKCIRLYKARAQKVLDAMRLFARTDSLHQGKAFAMRYFDDDGDIIPWPKPTFFPLDVEMPIFR